VRHQTNEMTSEWVKATITGLPPGGRRKKTPGDKTKANVARYRNIIMFIVLHANILSTLGQFPAP
jgi:hypothetical protein